ncbi:MAG: MYXO-CTERM sorting domain-containing protein [Myxococcota bacterium]
MRTRILLAASALVLVQASGVSAQVFRVTLTSIDGPGNGPDGIRTEAEGRVNQGVNAADCESEASRGATTLTFSIDGTGNSQLQVWRGAGSLDCSSAENRTGDISNLCDDIGPESVADETLEITLDELLMGTGSGSDACETDAAEGDVLTVYFFDTPNSLGNDDGTTFVTQQVVVDPTPPIAPTFEQDAVSGNSQVSLSWNDLTDNRIRYQLFADTSLKTCADSDLLVPGMVPTGVAALETTEELVASATVNPTSDLRLGVGESTRVYVAGFDNAENVGVLSQGVCVTRVETFAFCDALDDMAREGMDVDTCPDGCDAGGSGGASMAFALVALFAWRRRFGAEGVLR